MPGRVFGGNKFLLKLFYALYTTRATLRDRYVGGGQPSDRRDGTACSTGPCRRVSARGYVGMGGVLGRVCERVYASSDVGDVVPAASRPSTRGRAATCAYGLLSIIPRRVGRVACATPASWVTGRVCDASTGAATSTTTRGRWWLGARRSRDLVDCEAPNEKQ